MLEGFDVRDYYTRRALRLYPLYILMLAASFFVFETAPLDALAQSALLLSGLHSLTLDLWMPDLLWVL